MQSYSGGDEGRCSYSGGGEGRCRVTGVVIEGGAE